MVFEILGSIFMVIHCSNFLCAVVDTFMNIFVFLKREKCIMTATKMISRNSDVAIN